MLERDEVSSYSMSIPNSPYHLYLPRLLPHLMMTMVVVLVLVLVVVLVMVGFFFFIGVGGLSVEEEELLLLSDSEDGDEGIFDEGGEGNAFNIHLYVCICLSFLNAFTSASVL